MKRRGFLESMFAAAAAPAIVRAESLMPIVPPKIWTPPQGIVAPENGWVMHPIDPADKLFDAGLYTGTGQHATIHHALGYAPSFILIKQRKG